MKSSTYILSEECIITIIPLNEGRKSEKNWREIREMTLELKSDFILQYEPFKC